MNDVFGGHAVSPQDALGGEPRRVGAVYPSYHPYESPVPGTQETLSQCWTNKRIYGQVPLRAVRAKHQFKAETSSSPSTPNIWQAMLTFSDIFRHAKMLIPECVHTVTQDKSQEKTGRGTVREKKEIKCGSNLKWGRSNKRKARFRERKPRTWKEELGTEGEEEREMEVGGMTGAMCYSDQAGLKDMWGSLQQYHIFQFATVSHIQISNVIFHKIYLKLCWKVQRGTRCYWIVVLFTLWKGNLYFQAPQAELNSFRVARHLLMVS